MFKTCSITALNPTVRNQSIRAAYGAQVSLSLHHILASICQYHACNEAL